MSEGSDEQLAILGDGINYSVFVIGESACIGRV